MKIAVVGCGAVGSYYGAMLCRDGRDVHFLLRSDYDVVRRNGVNIHSPAGDFNARPRCARSSEEIGACDLVVIGLKTTANDQLKKLISPLVASHTAVLTLQNGLGNEERLAEFLPVEQILGGLCFVCLNRTAPGVIHHIGQGMVVIGEFQRWPEPRTHDLISMFRHAGVTCKVADNLARAHWEKLVWNIPFNGLGVASAAGYDGVAGLRSDILTPLGPCLTTDKLLGNSRWEQLVRELMLEVIVVANALGLEVAESIAEKQISRTRTLGLYKASTLIDFEQGKPLELDSLFLEPLRLAQSKGMQTPRLTALCEVLQRLDKLR